MGQTVGEIDLGLKVNQSMFNKQITGIAKSAQNPIMNAFKPIGKLIGSVLAVGAITKFTKECINLGSDLTEVQNVVDTTFKSLNGLVNEFASNAMMSFGLSETVAKQYMGTLGAMSKSMGFTEQASFDMASAVTGLAGDVASFYNLSTDEAFDKLKSIWTGETETLKSIGVLLTQTNLDQYALNNGFGKTTASMTEQEKVMLRYQYTMSALADASGDFAKTAGSWANQTRILSLQFDSLKATLGQGFINLFTPIIQMINTLLAKLQVLAQQFKSFTELLMGNKGNSSGMASIAKDAAGATAGLNGVTDAAKEAAKAAGLLSIDELNVVGDTSGSDVSGAISGIGDINSAAGDTAGALDVIDAGLQSLVDTCREFFEQIKTIVDDFKTGNFFKAGQDVSKLVSGIFNTFSKAIESVDWDKIGNNIGEFLKGIDWTEILSSVGNLLWQAINAVIELWKGSFDAAPIETGIITAISLLKWTGLGKAFSKSILKSAASLDFIGILSKILYVSPETLSHLFVVLEDQYFRGTWLDTNTWTGIFKDIDNAINWFIDTVIGGLVGFFTDGIMKQLDFSQILELWDGTLYFFEKIGEDFRKKDWGAIGIDIVSGIVGGITTVLAVVTHPFTALFNWIYDGICDVFGIHSPAAEMYPLGEYILLGIVEGFSNTISTFTEAITSWFDNSVKPWFTKEKWMGIFSGIKTALTTKWTEIKDWWDNNALVKWWKDSVEPWFTKDKWANSMTGIKDAFAEAFKNACNAGIEKFNQFINWLNEKMHFSWDPIVVAGKEIIPGADFQLFSVPNIPLLAQGGYVGADQPQLAVIGDNKREGEIVSPESKLLDMAVRAAEIANGNNMGTELLATIIELLGRIITILENLNLDIELDGRSLLQSLRDSQTKLGHQF